MHEANQVEKSKDVKEVVQLVFSKTKEAGAAKFIEYADDLKMYFPTKDMEEIIHLLVDDYEESVFWAELAHKLAQRDFINKYGEEIIEKMPVKKEYN